MGILFLWKRWTSQCDDRIAMFFSGNNIGAQGAAVLASALQRCSQLQSLELADNNIGAEGAAALAAALQHIFLIIFV